MSDERDTLRYFQDMLGCIERIENYCAGVTVSEFAANLLLQDAVVRRLEFMGEAAKRVPQAVRTQNPDIPWRRIAGLRDVRIHDYSGVNVTRIWQVIIDDLPAAKSSLERVQADLESGDRKNPKEECIAGALRLPRCCAVTR